MSGFNDRIVVACSFVLAMRTAYWVAFAVSSASEPPLNRPSVKSLRQLFERGATDPQAASNTPDSGKDAGPSVKPISQSDDEIMLNRFRFEITTIQPPSDRRANLIPLKKDYREFNRWRGY